MAPLLPKLRGHFAEFLNNASPVGLRILSSSTCVGLRYGHLKTIAAFLDAWLTHFPTLIGPHHVFALPQRICQFSSYLACTGTSIPGFRSPSVSPQFCLLGTGISTCCPSATPFGLALGPDLPRADQLYSGNLDIRPEGFSPSSRYSFRHSLFYTVHSSLRYCFSPAYTMLLYQ